MKIQALFILLLLVVLVSGCISGSMTGTDVMPENTSSGDEIQVIENITTGSDTVPENYTIQTFYDTENEMCTVDGTPIVMLFSTTRCPHCTWIKETFDKVALEYMREGKIFARHWELDKRDDTLTGGEDELSEFDVMVYQTFNPRGSVPTFVFGCRYLRIGNGFERTPDGLALEETEFRAVFDSLIEDVS